MARTATQANEHVRNCLPERTEHILQVHKPCYSDLDNDNETKFVLWHSTFSHSLCAYSCSNAITVANSYCSNRGE